MSVAENLVEIKNRMEQACVKSNRKIDEIEIVAVTKYVSIERAKEAIDAGIKHIGENRAEGILQKHEAISDLVKWHFIGTLQSRKVKDVIDYIDYVHSLDRLSLAKEINKRSNRVIPCFVQVNVSGEDTKHGIRPDEIQPFIRNLSNYENIEVVGLMTMAPHVDDASTIRNCFQKLRHLRDDIEALNLPNAPCHYLSMGMSNDYEIAIEEGATHIRIGTSLVGKED